MQYMLALVDINKAHLGEHEVLLGPLEAARMVAGRGTAERVPQQAAHRHSRYPGRRLHALFSSKTLITSVRGRVSGWGTCRGCAISGRWVGGLGQDSLESQISLGRLGGIGIMTLRLALSDGDSFVVCTKKAGVRASLVAISETTPALRCALFV